MESACKECGYKHGVHADPFDEAATPEPGDISMCLNCGFLGIFEYKGGELQVRPAYESDMKGMPYEYQQQLKEILRARKVIVSRDLRTEKEGGGGMRHGRNSESED